MGTRIYNVDRKTLKNKLLNYSVNEKGEKVTKFSLCKNIEFLKSIGCNSKYISPNTIQSWYKRLSKFEPIGEMTDKFIYDYHKNVTKRISKKISYIDWTKDKKNLYSENLITEKIKDKINWNDKKKYLAMLKLNNNNFNIEKYSHLNESDLKFMIDMFIEKNNQLKFENKLEKMISNGDENIVDYLF